MEQKPAGENPEDAQIQPEIVIAPQGSETTGPPQNKICPKCGTANPPQNNFCFKCGAQLTDTAIQGKKICAGCGAPNSPSSQYCYKCGLQLPDKLGGSQEIRYAGFWVRLMAFIINGILLYIVCSIITAAIYIRIYGSSSYSSLLSRVDARDYDSSVWAFVWIFILTVLFVQIISSTLTIGRWGRTVGKAALKLKVVKPDGSRVSYWRAFGRNLAYLLNLFTFGLSFLIIAFTHNKRGLHDYVADTVVIKTD